MTTYLYKAKKNTAETVTGKVTAQTQDEAIDIINQLGLLPVSVEEQAASGATKKKARRQKIKPKELYVFSLQLANLLKSGVPLIRALSIIEEQTVNLYFKEVIADVCWQVKNGGKSFSEALSAYPKIFSKLYLTMINAGEESGNLQEILRSVSIYQRKQEELKLKVRNALAYPTLMGMVGLATIFFIFTFVLPKMSGLFQSIGDDLPLITVALLSVSQIVNKGWFGIVLALLMVWIFLDRWRKSAQGKIALSRFAIRLPLFGDIILKTELARFSRTLVLLMNSGVTIIRAFEVATPVLDNGELKVYFDQCKEDLTSGGSLGESMQKYKTIPNMMGHLIAIGEESGRLTEVLEEVADSYEQETEETIKMLTSLLEPVMILTIGLIIGVIVFAILLPIFQIDVLAQ